MTDHLKRQASLAALDEVQEGMVVGLGTGSTVKHFIRELGARVKAGLRVTGIPTSVESERLAQGSGIPLGTFEEHQTVDLTVDGADEVSPELDLIKGLGGALVREKIVARASCRNVIMVDETKLVGKLGTRVPIPIEVVPFAADLVLHRLQQLGGAASVRDRDGARFVSDNGNHIIDWHHGPIEDPASLEHQIKQITGVVDSGIFAGTTHRLIVAGPSGIRKIDRR